CLVLRKMQDKPAGIAKIGVRPAVGLRGRRVERLHESGGEPATIHGTANVSGVDLPVAHALADEEHAKLEIGDQHGPCLFQYLGGAADMVVMAMGQKHMGHAFGWPFNRKSTRLNSSH